MCNCKDKKHHEPDCFELDTPKCDEGCVDVLSTDCIFHNINSTDQSGKLTHIGVYKGASLNYILKKINEKLGESVNTNFTGFNMHGLNNNTEIVNIKQFIEAVTKKIEDLEEIDEEIDDDIEGINTLIDALNVAISNINNPGISNSVLNISNTDNIKTVLNKLISYVVDLTPAEISETTFQNSSTIDFSVSDDAVTANVKLSTKSGNRAYEEEDGIYVSDPSVSSILNSIQNNVELKTLFTSAVATSLPCFYFDIMSTTNQAVEYINCRGVSVTATAQANRLLRLSDVRRIITVPTTSLTITFKGI